MPNTKKLKIRPLTLLLGALAVVIIIICLVLFSNDSEDFMSDGVLRVCLDAGHGGDDPGATDGNERYEKDDCLRLVLAVKDCLERDFPDVDIALTRDGDTYPTLEDRCDIANDCHADLFVSVHRNSSEGAASGVEIWVESKRPKTDSALAGEILSGLKSVGVSNDRGVKYGTASNPTGDYYVNKNTDMPACLIEMGFITSETDNELLDTYLDSYAKAISDAIGQTLTR